MNNDCTICGEGQLQDHSDKQNVEHKGSNGAISFHYSECDFCGSEQASSSQVRDNKRSMIAFKKEVEGLLTGSELKNLRTKLNITQAGATELFGGGPVAFSKYEADDVMQSTAMDRVYAAVPEALAYLSKGTSLELKQDQESDYKPLNISTDLAIKSESKERSHLRIVRNNQNYNNTSNQDKRLYG